MRRRPPSSTRSYTFFPDTTRFRSPQTEAVLGMLKRGSDRDGADRDGARRRAIGNPGSCRAGGKDQHLVDQRLIGGLDGSPRYAELRRHVEQGWQSRTGAQPDFDDRDAQRGRDLLGEDRKSVVSGKSVERSVDLVGRPS